MKDHGKYETIGETLDDAAGEAFDKAAQLLGLGYPGGPAISKEASKYKNNKNKKISLPRPMINKPNFDFSFSGLKTALFYAIKKDKNYKKRISEYAYEFEQAVVQVLVEKTIKAGLKYKAKTIMLSGGVSANKELRKKIKQAVKRLASPCELTIPDLKYTTDNAAMIATAAYFHALKKDFSNIEKLKVFPNKTIHTN
jgi:N6-L-threonylcarbamoyladenine synthase